tara:strand:- start:120 stop:596 length:477 start_codon:yes stop_codon:yes gene_type:complete
MLTNEVFWKMDLRCIYKNGIAEEIGKGFYVYVIINADKYYVGLTTDFKARLPGHLRTNTNNIRDDESCIYILENVDNEFHMRMMEYIWIIWFCLNTDCVNVERGTYKVRKGYINRGNLWYIASNYKIFCDFDYIVGVKLLQGHQKSSNSEKEYFGRCL